MCRSRHQNITSTYPQLQPVHTTPRQRREANRQDKFGRHLQHGCCSKRARRYRKDHIPISASQLTTNVFPVPNITRGYTVPDSLQPNTQSSIPPFCTPFRHRGPLTTMAALIIGGIGLGAQKIQEKRVKKKAKKAALQLDQETDVEASRKANWQHVERIRKSEESAAETTRRRSESLEREREESGEMPPSYEEVIATGSGRV